MKARQKHIAKRLVRHAKNNFIPHKGNKYHPRALHYRALLAYSILAILLKAAATIALIALPSSSLFATEISQKSIVALTNAARSASGLNTLEVNDKLTRAAQAKAQDMLNNQYFAHTSPAGIRPWDWIKQTGYTYLYSGENLAVHYETAEAVQDGWMASPGHRANILNPHYTQIGVAISNGAFEGVPTTFAVEMFGDPLPAPTADVAPTPDPIPLPVAPPVAVQAVTSTPHVVLATTQTTKKPAIPNPIKITPPKTAAPQPSKTTIDETSVKVIPVAAGFDVHADVTSATRVFALMNGEQTEMAQTAGSTNWHGIVPQPAATANAQAQSLTLAAWSPNGDITTLAAGDILPHSSLAQVYGAENVTLAPAKLFGFIPLGAIDDGVHLTYIALIILLCTTLLLNIFIKIEIQHPNVIAQTVGVIALVTFLLLK